MKLVITLNIDQPTERERRNFAARILRNMGLTMLSWKKTLDPHNAGKLFGNDAKDALVEAGEWEVTE
jgi:hypothetical protein